MLLVDGFQRFEFHPLFRRWGSGGDVANRLGTRNDQRALKSSWKKIIRVDLCTGIRLFGSDHNEPREIAIDRSESIGHP